MAPRQAPLQESDLIFSSAASELRDALGQLKKHHLSIRHRLQSIKHDSHFVCAVSDAYRLPLVANERCGSWYTPPDNKSASTYFKSTDGHFGQWSFSLRRLNLHVLDVVGKYGGCVIVDSTRRGKSMPDALSKTVPIWVCVLNRLLFPEDHEAGGFMTHGDVVGESEHAQIESRLGDLLENVKHLSLDLNTLRKGLKYKPMAVTWQRPGDAIPVAQTRSSTDPHLLVLCTASSQTSNETSATSEYVQGAADDPESWSWGLDAATFWRYQHELLKATEDELPDLISALISKSDTSSIAHATTLIKPSITVYIGANEAATKAHSDFDIIISCTVFPSEEVLCAKKQRYIALLLPEGKIGSRALRTELPKTNAVQAFLQNAPMSRILVTCKTGNNFSVGVALALLCLYFDDRGLPVDSLSVSTMKINKSKIKQRLSWIMLSMPDAKPSRATLQSINSFLMG